MSAPFTNEQRSNIFVVDINPCIIPVIFKKSFSCEVLIEPCLLINRRAVVMRRVNDLLVESIVSKVNTVVSYTSEVSAPPCTVPWRLVSRSLPDIGSVIGKALFSLGILFNAFDEDKSIRVYLKDSLAAFSSSLSPVVFVCRTVPLSDIRGTYSTIVAALAVRLILQVIGNDSIVILVLISQPNQ